MTNDLLARLFRALDLVVVERQPNHTFYALTPEPTWFTRAFGAADAGEQHTLAGAFPFLDDFVGQAVGAWAAGPQASIVSGPFSVQADGEELLLRATALTIDGRALLVLERLTGAADARAMLQKARERMLENEELTRKVAALQAPAASLDRAVTAIAGRDLGPELQATVADLVGASGRLRDVLSTLPAPPTRPRR